MRCSGRLRRRLANRLDARIRPDRVNAPAIDDCQALDKVHPIDLFLIEDRAAIVFGNVLDALRKKLCFRLAVENFAVGIERPLQTTG